MYTTIDFYYFSPTGGTKKAGESFCRGIAEHVRSVDLCLRAKARQPQSSLAVFAVPVYGGRIPTLAAEKLHQLDGNGISAVTLAVYGNRAYEDALLELNQLLEKQGFQIAASAALLAQHSIVPEAGAGRPDEKDQAQTHAFAQKVLEKLKNGIAHPVNVPGNFPYKDGMKKSAPPLSLSSCSQCGTCATACPAGAVKMTKHTVQTDPQACILCMACIKACPQQARILPPPMQQVLNEKLAPFTKDRRENEYFL